jgi:phosphoesterase RecJ-like protein
VIRNSKAPNSKIPKDGLKKLNDLVGSAKTILILQPEKPDTDSLTSSLALENILGDQGKEIVLYCKDPIPKYISYFSGADRIVDEFPNNFDFTILVDTGGPQMLTRTLESYGPKLQKKPFVIVDHHANRSSMPFETIDIIEPSATSTCELVVDIARNLDWKISAEAASLIVPGILADTRNLSIQATTPKTVRTVADMMEAGADLFAIHSAYREADALIPELLELKGRLLSRMELFADGKIALIVVTPEELKQFADIHDPADLIVYEMQWAKGVEIAVVMRNYGTKIKVSTRANMPVAAQACGEFGGGGHDRAAGCQINDTPIAEAKANFVKVLTQKIKDYEALQHADETKRQAQTA